MSGEFIAFFILALMTIGGGVFMISFTRVIHMVVALAFTFLSIAGLYVLLEAEFVAITQVLVYAGAISILMLFGIMLTRHDVNEGQGRKDHQAAALIVIVLFFAIVFWGIQGMEWTNTPASLAEHNTLEIGKQMFTRYVIPFELVSVVLLVALIGAITLAKGEEDEK